MQCLLQSTLILLSLAPKPTALHIRVNADGSTEYELLIVTDLDKDSKAGEWLWRAVSRRGRLTLNRERTHVNISWEIESEHNLTSSTNVKGRAMELSDLSVFHNRTLTPDDRTGMISEIKDNKMIPRVFLNSGPGNTTYPFKAEWMTIKDDMLYVGSHGNEWVDLKTGAVLHRNNMCIKTVSPAGRIFQLMIGTHDLPRGKSWLSIMLLRNSKRLHLAWNEWNFNLARHLPNLLRDLYPKSAPPDCYLTPGWGNHESGYLTHEAVQWSKIRKHWYFLPRKESATLYNETLDEWKGTNLLITGDPDLRNFTYIRVGDKCPDRGYSAFDFIPNTNDELIVALKTSEVTSEPTETFVTVFTTDGQILLGDTRLDGDYKFEGIYFI